MTPSRGRASRDRGDRSPERCLGTNRRRAVELVVDISKKDEPHRVLRAMSRLAIPRDALDEYARFASPGTCSSMEGTVLPRFDAPRRRRRTRIPLIDVGVSAAYGTRKWG